MWHSFNGPLLGKLEESVLPLKIGPHTLCSYFIKAGDCIEYMSPFQGLGHYLGSMFVAHRETQGVAHVRFDGRCPSLTYYAPSGRDRPHW